VACDDVGQDGRRPPAVSREQLSPAAHAPVQRTGTGQGMHISKHTRVALAAVAGGDEINRISIAQTLIT